MGDEYCWGCRQITGTVLDGQLTADRRAAGETPMRKCARTSQRPRTGHSQNGDATICGRVDATKTKIAPSFTRRPYQFHTMVHKFTIITWTSMIIFMNRLNFYMSNISTLLSSAGDNEACNIHYTPVVNYKPHSLSRLHILSCRRLYAVEATIELISPHESHKFCFMDV